MHLSNIDSMVDTFRMTSKDLQEKKIVQEVETGRATPACEENGEQEADNEVDEEEGEGQEEEEEEESNGEEGGGEEDEEAEADVDVHTEKQKTNEGD
uniref:Prothymosin alpha n=1 Tax=Panthera tigris altaica TaxID=74533 RepID=A0A8C9JIE6_PANTA